MWDKNQTARWSAICALLAILTVTGCASSSEPVAQVPDPTATASNPVGSPLPDAAPPSPTATDLPSATPSPTPVPPTQPPNPTPTVTATPSPTPTSTPIPSPTPTPTPTLRQLTQGSCCTQPFWAPDSRQLLFIDKPSPDLPTGIWSVDVTESEPMPELLTEQIAFYTPDLNFRTELNQDSTTIERLASPLPSDDDSSDAGSALETNPQSETSWEVPSEGQPVYISPSEHRIVWQVSKSDLPFERRTAQIWVADLDGSVPQMVADLPRGGFNGWISDDAILLSGRETLESQEQVLFALSLSDGSRVELARGKRLRGGLLSPEGTWLAYFVALDEDPSQNGMWLIRSDGTERHGLGSDLFGAYQWRDDHRLLIIPFQPGAASHEFWEFDVSTGQTRRLTDPEVTPFKIANGDWTVSPDGQQVAFVESRDRNIWLLTLPD